MRVTWQSLALAVLVGLIGVTLALQRQVNAELRGMIGLFRGQNHELDRLRAERLRLGKALISAAELESLRADHAALTRLRGEIEMAKARLIEIEQAEPAPASHH